MNPRGQSDDPGPAAQPHRRRTGRITLLFALVLALSVSAVPVFAAIAGGRTLYASPAGSGSACTSANPCALPSAVSAANGGDSILLLQGSYGDVTVKGGAGTAGNRITVAPAPGATVTFGRLATNSPNITWRSVTVTITFYINAPAVGTTTDSVMLDGGGMFVRSKDVTVTNSEFRNGSSLDGIQIGRASNVLIQHNVIHDYNQSGTSGYHADCIQIFDSSGVTIRGNNMRNCYNSAIIFSSGSGGAISNVVIEANFIQGCLVKSAACNNGNALDLRYTSTSAIVVRNNSFLNSSVRLLSPGVTFDRNIVDYLSDCGARMTNTIVSRWNLGLCKQPSNLGTKGNRQGTVPVVNPQVGDLHLLTADSARIVPYPGTTPAPRDYDGDNTAADIAGADTPTGGSTPPSSTPPTGPGRDTTAPKIAIVSPANGSTISGPLLLQATATDNVAVTGVGFYLNSTLIGNATYSSGIWRLPIDTKGLPAGRYTITARASDAAGNTGDSTPVTGVVR